MAENVPAGRQSAARGGVAAVLVTAMAAMSRLPHETFFDGIVVAGIAVAALLAAWVPWRLPRRQSIGG
ncbi:hypothetical protein [Ancylobacter defluvii]|uniref:Uncharacterized protein n=1 Tax=Ancylobacter defluvii TaxID=1282440 RepID=A0A9W6NC32_9HYPH|nr:hypothetical protein [Ancylobacter defluvii]MBS7589621.1 hypothetical protein [Ancylobacter defluvii]GLK85240.1 hypothetical protein GCM10017653_33100 [Ancylobacter defluvii]